MAIKPKTPSGCNKCDCPEYYGGPSGLCGNTKSNGTICAHAESSHEPR